MIGKTISHYKILEEIGAGGMGIVYKAEDTLLQRHVALKFLPPELTRDQEAKERFIQEAQSASALDHPNICTIYEINKSDEGQMFIVMANYEGEILKKIINRGPLALGHAIDITIQISQGLVRAHEEGIIHRDIKPANIIVTHRSEVKILDFGLAKLTGRVQLTRDVSTLGTVAYMSPEQLSRKEVDHRTDLWSLGVVLYEMLTGKVPFPGDYEQAIIYSILNEEPIPPANLRSDLSSDLENIIKKSLNKDPDKRYSSGDQIIADLEKYKESLIKSEMRPSISDPIFQHLRKPHFIGGFILTFLIILALFWFIHRRSKVGWAKEKAIPEIEKIIKYARVTGLSSAYKIAEEAEKYIPDDPDLQELLSKCSITLSIESNPSDAKIYVKEYSAYGRDWNYIGLTPINSIRMARDYFRWKIEKTGYETVYYISNRYRIKKSLEFELDKDGSIPAGMIRVKGSESEIGSLPDFFYDRYEVTNKDFKQFINNGGYSSREYWKIPFLKDGKALTWEEALAYFVDTTGRPGPATWTAGDYPDGKDNYPVTGVSWYEAAAFATFRKKELPTIYHWSMANGIEYPFPQLPPSLIIPLSNFSPEGPAPVGSHPGISISGAYDIAGNVREWCYNESESGRCIRGGAWSDASYMAARITQASPFDRSSQNGFRCVKYLERDNIPEIAFQPFSSARQGDDYRNRQPVSDEIFQVYKETFSYDKEPLDPEIVYRDGKPEDWIKEKISFNAAYQNERIIAYLYLPKNVAAPYQTILIFPHSGATRGESSEHLEKTEGFDFFMKDGRAVMYPVYKGTYERGGTHYWYLHGQVSTRKYFDLITQIVLDFRRCMDYLETRPDINMNKIAYYSYSWGGELMSIIAAVEERLKLNIINTGGMRGFDAGGKIYAMADPIHYVTRVKIPTLMLNGEYDMIYQYDKVVKPMYELLGTPEKDKLLLTYPTDHYVPINDLIRESLKWLDRYFGPAK